MADSKDQKLPVVAVAPDQSMSNMFDEAIGSVTDSVQAGANSVQSTVATLATSLKSNQAQLPKSLEKLFRTNALKDEEKNREQNSFWSALSKNVDKLTSTLDSIKDKVFKAITPKNLLGGLFAAILGVGVGFVSAFGDVFSRLLAISKKNFGIVGSSIESLASFVRAGFVKTQKSLSFVFGKGSRLGKVLKSLSGVMLKPLKLFSGIYNTLKSVVKNPLFRKIFSIFKTIGKKVLFPVFTVLETVVGAIKGFNKDGILGAIAGGIAGILDFLSFGILDFDRLYELFERGFSDVQESIMSIINNGFSVENITQLASGILASIVAIPEALIEGILTLISWGARQLGFEQYADMLSEFVSGFDLMEIVSRIRDGLTDIFARIYNGIIELFENPGESIVSAMSGIKDFVGNILGSIGRLIRDSAMKALGFLGDAAFEAMTLTMSDDEAALARAQRAADRLRSTQSRIVALESEYREALAAKDAEKLDELQKQIQKIRDEESSARKTLSSRGLVFDQETGDFKAIDPKEVEERGLAIIGGDIQLKRLVPPDPIFTRTRDSQIRESINPPVSVDVSMPQSKSMIPAEIRATKEIIERTERIQQPVVVPQPVPMPQKPSSDSGGNIAIAPSNHRNDESTFRRLSDNSFGGSY